MNQNQNDINPPAPMAFQFLKTRENSHKRSSSTASGCSSQSINCGKIDPKHEISSVVEKLGNSWSLAQSQRGSFLVPEAVFPGVTNGHQLHQRVAELTPLMWSFEREIVDLRTKASLRQAFVKMRTEANIISSCEVLWDTLTGLESTSSMMKDDISNNEAIRSQLRHWIAIAKQEGLSQNPLIQQILKTTWFNQVPSNISNVERTLTFDDASTNTLPLNNFREDNYNTCEQPNRRLMNFQIANNSDAPLLLSSSWVGDSAKSPNTKRRDAHHSLRHIHRTKPFETICEQRLRDSSRNEHHHYTRAKLPIESRSRQYKPNRHNSHLFPPQPHPFSASFNDYSSTIQLSTCDQDPASSKPAIVSSAKASIIRFPSCGELDVFHLESSTQNSNLNNNKGEPGKHESNSFTSVEVGNTSLYGRKLNTNIMDLTSFKHEPAPDLSLPDEELPRNTLPHTIASWVGQYPPSCNTRFSLGFKKSTLDNTFSDSASSNLVSLEGCNDHLRYAKHCEEKGATQFPPIGHITADGFFESKDDGKHTNLTKTKSTSLVLTPDSDEASSTFSHDTSANVSSRLHEESISTEQKPDLVGGSRMLFLQCCTPKQGLDGLIEASLIGSSIHSNQRDGDAPVNQHKKADDMNDASHLGVDCKLNTVGKNKKNNSQLEKVAKHFSWKVTSDDKEKDGSASPLPVIRVTRISDTNEVIALRQRTHILNEMLQLGGDDKFRDSTSQNLLLRPKLISDVSLPELALNPGRAQSTSEISYISDEPKDANRRSSVLSILTNGNRCKYYKKRDALQKYINHVRVEDVLHDRDEQATPVSSTHSTVTQILLESALDSPRREKSNKKSSWESSRGKDKFNLCLFGTAMGRDSSYVPHDVIHSLTRHLKQQQKLDRVIEESRKRLSLSTTFQRSKSSDTVEPKFRKSDIALGRGDLPKHSLTRWFSNCNTTFSACYDEFDITSNTTTSNVPNKQINKSEFRNSPSANDTDPSKKSNAIAFRSGKLYLLRNTRRPSSKVSNKTFANRCDIEGGKTRNISPTTSSPALYAQYELELDVLKSCKLSSIHLRHKEKPNNDIYVKEFKYRR